MPNSADNTLLLHSLSQLTLNPANAEDAVRYLDTLNPEGREHFESVADSNHVVVRALQAALARLDRDSVEVKDPLKPNEGLNGAPGGSSGMNEDPLKPKDGLNGAPGDSGGAKELPPKRERMGHKDGLDGAPALKSTGMVISGCAAAAAYSECAPDLAAYLPGVGERGMRDHSHEVTRSLARLGQRP